MIDIKFNGDNILTIPVELFKDLANNYINNGQNRNTITDLQDFLEFLNSII